MKGGIVHQRLQGGIAQVLVHIYPASIFQSVPLGVPLKCQREGSILILNSLNNSIGGLSHHSYTLTQIFGVDRLVMGGSDQVNAVRADNIIQPLGILGNTNSLIAVIQLMIAGAAAMDQAIDLYPQMSLFTSGVKVCIGLGIRIVRLAQEISLGIIHGIAGILYRIGQDLRNLLQAILLTRCLQLCHIRLRRSGENSGHTGGRNFTIKYLLSQVVRNILNQAATHSHIEALGAAAHCQQRNIHSHSLLHQVKIRCIPGVVPAGRAMRTLSLIIEVGIPVLTTSEEDTVQFRQNLSRFLLRLYLSQVYSNGSVSLKSFGKTLVVISDLVLFPGDTYHRPRCNLGHLYLGHSAVFQSEVGRNGIPQIIRGPKSVLQCIQRIDSLARHLGFLCNRRRVDYIVFQFTIGVNDVQNCVRHCCIRLCRLRTDSKGQQSQQHAKSQQHTEQPHGFSFPDIHKSPSFTFPFTRYIHNACIFHISYLITRSGRHFCKSHRCLSVLYSCILFTVNIFVLTTQHFSCFLV